ncbi:helix-turn-helix domain-containing protein [Candidatus Pacearchaeota archaeon]|nr:helix-turn-helix domain-containing protein [Candidatus Pacearchaeota archaeon]
MENEKKLLVDYGLREAEAEIYIACLRLGNSTVYKIAEKVRLPKSTVYDTLKSLNEKGLVTFIIKSGVKYFEAVSPNKLVDILDEKKAKISDAIPKLKEIQEKVIDKPEVNVYYGKEGLKTILQDVLKIKKDFHIIGNFEEFEEYFDFYSSLFVKQRVKNKIICKLIEEKSKKNLQLKKNDKKEKRITKFLAGIQDLKSEIYVYGDKIALLTLMEEEPVGVVIKNKEMAKLMKFIFEKVWNMARK